MGLRASATAMPVLNSSSGAAVAAAAIIIHGTWLVSVNSIPENPADWTEAASAALSCQRMLPVIKSNFMIAPLTAPTDNRSR